MIKKLGLDLGTNSIGWALIEEGRIIKLGSRIFPEGVVNLGDGEGREQSKNSSRTEARGRRRQFFRRRLRKRYLLKELAKNGLCPLTSEQVKLWNQSGFFETQELKSWFALNPYELRVKAIHEEVTLHELGRIFYHMIQRRGFLSNSRSASAELNEKSVIFKGDDKVGKIGIAKTLDDISEHKTLGAYLATIAPKENEPFKNGQERIRNRYTTRQMFIDEFEIIWEAQKKYHTALTDELKSIIGGRKKDGYKDDGVLFHQRPLRSQKHLVGNCSFEPKKSKALKSTIYFEQFRVYQWVNTVECNGKRLSKEDREVLADQLFLKESVTFKALRKSLKKLDAYYQFNYNDDDKVVGTHTISKLSNKKFFGKEWFDYSEDTQEKIWNVLYFFDDRDKLKQYAIEHWGFDHEKAEAISKFNLKDGYANLSLKAIKNILPFLKSGFQYDVAVGLGGVKNALGEQWEENKAFVLDNVPEIVRSNLKGGYIEPLKQTLQTEFNLSNKQLLKLYHHSTSIATTSLLEKLPLGKEADREIQNIKNPVVVTALFELRKLVNELIDTYGKIDEIKVEMARDLKASKSQRNKVRLEQRRLERENDRVKDRLEKEGIRITHDNMLKYKLWEECNRRCPFTGKNIAIEQLFSGDIQIEHIFPWSRSLNDSFMNKTLCYADENRAKGNQTPYEFYSAQGEEKWAQIKQQALSCFSFKKEYPNAYKKFKHFVRKTHDSDFISRQLNDTRYISKEAKNYLSKICNNVTVSPGQATAKLRYHWGLNGILNEENAKVRTDHRHHAIDALVMACTTRGHLQELSKWNSYNRSYETKDFIVPWEGFLQDATKEVDNILVSHRRDKNLLTVRKHFTKKDGKVYSNIGVAARGQLHKETVYGKRTAPDTLEPAFHVRKPVVSLTPPEITKIVDSKIREIVYENIQNAGLLINSKDKKPVVKTPEEKKTFEKVLSEGFYLPNKKGEPVPIRKVRIRKRFTKVEPLKGDVNQWVDLQNNHHVLIYKDEEGNLKEDVVTFWLAVERKRQKQPVIQLPSDGFEIVTTLQINDMFLLGLKEDEINWENPDYNMIRRHLFRVQSASSFYYEFRMSTNTESQNKKEPYYFYIRSFGNGKTGWNTLNPIKVRVSSIGSIFKI